MRKEGKSLADGAIKILESYDWPSNIKELKEYIDCAHLMSFTKTIDLNHFPDIIKIKDERDEGNSSVRESRENIMSSVNYSFGSGQIDEADLTLASIEKRHICMTLDQLKGNKTRAAKVLGITVKTLYNKLHLYGMVQ